MHTTPFDPIVLYSSSIFFKWKWIQSNCIARWKREIPIKTNKISVIIFRYLLNFGLISIMPFHQCMIPWICLTLLWRYFRCALDVHLALVKKETGIWKARGKIDSMALPLFLLCCCLCRRRCVCVVFSRSLRNFRSKSVSMSLLCLVSLY